MIESITVTFTGDEIKEMRDTLNDLADNGLMTEQETTFLHELTQPLRDDPTLRFPTPLTVKMSRTGTNGLVQLAFDALDLGGPREVWGVVGSKISMAIDQQVSADQKENEHLCPYAEETEGKRIYCTCDDDTMQACIDGI